MSQFEDRFWSSRDGLRLHYRDYPAAQDSGLAPVLCLPGLTRNARDFAGLAQRVAGAPARSRRVLCPDMRGRGDSAYAKDSGSYQPLQYVEDVEALLDEAGLDRLVVVGTSLGGLMAMIMAMRTPQQLIAAVMNDIGPVIEPDGLERIRDYVGQGRSYPTWMHAARALQETHEEAFPDFAISDWLAMAKRLMTLGQNGRIVLDYDMKIAEPFAESATSGDVDLWPAFDALATGRPLLILRGGLSDLFSAATLDGMARRAADAEALTLPRIGHAPTLDEPEAIAAIDRLLARVG